MNKLPSKLKQDIILETTFGHEVSNEYDRINIDIPTDENDYPEIELMEVPVVKKMVFQFNKPVKLKFYWGVVGVL